MRLLKALFPALLLLSGGLAHAHGGYETETEVRIYPDRMRIVTRASLPFAWRILGDNAPDAADEAGQAAAKPLLAKMAATLFKITAGGKPLSPTKADCVFEKSDLHDDAAFVLEFARPTASPVAVRATFFPLLGELDTGIIAVFDQTAAPFQRDIEPLLDKSISRQSPGIGFDLGGPKEASPEATPSPTALPARVPTPTPAGPIVPPARHLPLPIAVAIAFLIIGVIWRLSKRNQNNPAA
jgi:hypothetical protein